MGLFNSLMKDMLREMINDELEEMKSEENSEEEEGAEEEAGAEEDEEDEEEAEEDANNVNKPDKRETIAELILKQLATENIRGVDAEDNDVDSAYCRVLGIGG